MSSRSSGVTNVRLLGDLGRDAFVLAPAQDEIVETLSPGRVVDRLQILSQQFSAGPGFLGTGLEQIEELFVLAQ